MEQQELLNRIEKLEKLLEQQNQQINSLQEQIKTNNIEETAFEVVDNVIQGYIANDDGEQEQEKEKKYFKLKNILEDRMAEITEYTYFESMATLRNPSFEQAKQAAQEAKQAAQEAKQAAQEAEQKAKDIQKNLYAIMSMFFAAFAFITVDIQVVKGLLTPVINTSNNSGNISLQGLLPNTYFVLIAIGLTQVLFFYGISKFIVQPFLNEATDFNSTNTDVNSTKSVKFINALHYILLFAIILLICGFYTAGIGNVVSKIF